MYKDFFIIKEQKSKSFESIFFSSQVKTLIQTIIDETQTNQILSGLVFSPGGKSRLFLKCCEHLCSVIIGKFLVYFGGISLTTLN
jgi:hypothetical protein